MSRTKHKKQPVVLVADDNRNNLSLAQEILEQAGYRVRIAMNGQDALSSAAIEAPDLFLLDIHMPVLDGYESCRRLKANPQLADIPVIFLSGLDETFNKIMAFEAGAADYISKPFQKEELLARISAHLQLYRTQLELKKQRRQLRKKIDELQTSQQQLADAQESLAVAELSAGLSHELKNPINYVVVGCAALEQDLQKWIAALDTPASYPSRQRYQEEIFQLLSGIKTGAERAAKILQELNPQRFDDLHS